LFYNNLNKGYPILLIFGTHIPDTTGHQKAVQFPTSPNVCFCTTLENRTDKICIKINKKNLIKFYLSGYVATNSHQLQGLTVVQQHVY